MLHFEKLSRAEMKNVLGGYVNNPSCKIGACILYVEALKQNVSGSCGATATSPNTWSCVCQAGDYQTNNGGSGCVYAS